ECRMFNFDLEDALTSFLRILLIAALAFCGLYLLIYGAVVAWRTFLLLLPALLIGATIIAGVVLIGFVGKLLYTSYLEQRAMEAASKERIKLMQSELLAPFLQALCHIYGRYDDCRDSLTDFYDE